MFCLLFLKSKVILLVLKNNFQEEYKYFYILIYLTFYKICIGGDYGSNKANK